MRGLKIDGLLEHDQRVLVYVLVTVMLVLLKTKQGQFGQHVCSEAGVDQ